MSMQQLAYFPCRTFLLPLWGPSFAYNEVKPPVGPVPLPTHTCTSTLIHGPTCGNKAWPVASKATVSGV